MFKRQAHQSPLANDFGISWTIVSGYHLKYENVTCHDIRQKRQIFNRSLLI